MRSMPTSTTCATSSATRPVSSRPSGEWAIGCVRTPAHDPAGCDRFASPLLSATEGMAAPGGRPSDDEAVMADARLIRRVRWRLVAWSAGVTLVVLLILGAVLYAAVARSLEASSLARLEARAQA